MDPFLTYINFCYNMRQIADNQCCLHPQGTADALLTWYQAPHWGDKGETENRRGQKKKGDPVFCLFPHCGA